MALPVLSTRTNASVTLSIEAEEVLSSREATFTASTYMQHQYTLACFGVVATSILIVILFYSN